MGASAVPLAFGWAHLRRRFDDFYQAAASPLVAATRVRIEDLKVGVGIRRYAGEWRVAGQERSKPPVDARHGWLAEQLGRGSAYSNLVEDIVHSELPHSDFNQIRLLTRLVGIAGDVSTSASGGESNKARQNFRSVYGLVSQP